MNHDPAFTWTVIDYSVDGTARSVTIVDAIELPDGTIEAAASTVTADGVKTRTATSPQLEGVWDRLMPAPGTESESQ